MPKAKTSNKTRTNKKVSKKPVNKFLVGGILVGIIAVVGIVVVYSSRAARVTHTVDSEVANTSTSQGKSTPDCIITKANNVYCTQGTYPNGSYRWQRRNDGKCAVIFRKYDNLQLYKGEGNADAGWIPISSPPPRGTQLRFAFTDTCDIVI